MAPISTPPNLELILASAVASGTAAIAILPKSRRV